MQIKTILKGKTNRRDRKTGIAEVKELTIAKYSVFSNQCESEKGYLKCDGKLVMGNLYSVISNQCESEIWSLECEVELITGNQCRLERGSLKRDVELVIGNQCKSESVRL